MPLCGLCGCGGKAAADVVEPGLATAAAAVKAPDPDASSSGAPSSSAQDAALDANVQSAERVLNFLMDATLPYVRVALGYMIVGVSDRDGRGDASGIPLGPTAWLEDDAYIQAPAARLIVKKKDRDGDGMSDIDPRTAVQAVDVELIDSRLIRAATGKHLRSSVGEPAQPPTLRTAAPTMLAEFTMQVVLHLHEDVDFSLEFDPSNALLQFSKTTKSRFLSWFYGQGAWATQWATPSLAVEVNRFQMECSVQIGFNVDYITLMFVKPAKVDWDVEVGVSPFGKVHFPLPDWFEDVLVPKAVEFVIRSIVGVRFGFPTRFLEKIVHGERTTEADGSPEHEELPPAAARALRMPQARVAPVEQI